MPLPRSPGDMRPSAQQLRAVRPLGAPLGSAAAVERAVAATGLPVEDLPAVVVEPNLVPVEDAMPPADERPTMRNRRLYRRVQIEADCEIDGAKVRLLDLSLGGLAAANAPPLQPGMVVPVRLGLAIDGVDISSRLRGRAIYALALRSGMRFVDLTASQTAMLRYLVNWRSQPAGMIATTGLLEAIGGSPERRPPAEPPAPTPPPPSRTPWWSRWFGRLLGAPRG